MTLSEKQRLFSLMFAKLVVWAFDAGYEVAIDHVARTLDQQKLYVAQGKAQTLQSKHLKRLAGDLLLFQGGKYLTRTEDYAPLGAWWKSQSPLAKWGGDWDDFKDGGHFEYDG